MIVRHIACNCSVGLYPLSKYFFQAQHFGSSASVLRLQVGGWNPGGLKFESSSATLLSCLLKTEVEVICTVFWLEKIFVQWLKCDRIIIQKDFLLFLLLS
jgi:hypothetical protein